MRDAMNPLADAESAAKATVPQMESIFGTTAAQAWNALGLTPIAGQNDDNENFTQSDASALESFAASNGVGELAFWEVDGYDKPLGYTYSSIFNQITGGGSSGGGAGTITENHTGLCLATTGESSTLKTTGDINTCDGSAAEHQDAVVPVDAADPDGSAVHVAATDAGLAVADEQRRRRLHTRDQPGPDAEARHRGAAPVYWAAATQGDLRRPDGGRRLRTLLQEPGVITDQDRLRVTQPLHHVVPHPVPDLVGVPDRLVQQPLYAIWRAIAGILGERLSVLALQRRKQAPHIPQGPLTRDRPQETVSEPPTVAAVVTPRPVHGEQPVSDRRLSL